jgi:hypothetical protein
MANQAEVLRLLREHPHATIAELVEASNPKDRHARVCMKNNFSNKLHHLRRFGLAEFTIPETGIEKRWYATTESE